MRLHHLSDLHGDWSRFPVREGDFLVVSGDLCKTGTAEEIDAALEWIALWPVSHRVVVPGNHDAAIAADVAGYRERWAERGIRLLVDEGVTLDGYALWGCPWVWDRSTWSWPDRDRAFVEAREPDTLASHPPVPEGVDLLITHGPARGLGDQYEPGSYWDGLGAGSLGDPAFRLVLERPRPPLIHCYGHVHHNPGVQKYCQTWCSNAAGHRVTFEVEGRTVVRFDCSPGP